MKEESKYKRMLELENQLRKALVENEFRLYYQPELDLDSGMIKGAEALIRWHHPVKGVIPPLEFIPLAEESGLILPIGEWVIRTACEKNKEWQEAGFPTMIMAVNLSARQLYQPDLVESIQLILEETGIDPEYLELEITESMMMDAHHVLPILHDLKRVGVKISLDDFGTGYSSLYFLKEFPIDKIKIDQSFVRNCTIDTKDATIVKAIIAMAHQLKIEVIAEGIETKEQLIFLQQNLSNKGQGYLFSQPLPPDELYQKFYGIEQIVKREGIPQKVSNQKWLEEALEMARQELHVTMRQQQGMIFKFIEMDGRFIHTLCDGELLYRMNLIPRQIIGKEVQDFLLKHDAENKQKHYQRAWNGEEITYEGHVNDIWYFASLRPIRRGGQVVEVIGSCIDITERKKIEEKLRLSEARNQLKGENIQDLIMEERINTFFNYTADAIDIVDLNGNVVYVNPAFKNMYGWDYEEMIGKPLPIIPSYKLSEHLHMVEQAKMGKRRIGFETTFVKKDGESIDVSLTLSPIRDRNRNIIGTSSIARDITKQNKLEISLKENEERYRRVVEVSSRGHIIHQEGTILYANPSALKIFKEKQLVGKSIFSYFHDDIDKFKQNLLEVDGKRTNRIELRMRLHDGEMIDTVMAGLSTNFNTKPATLVVFGDVSERKKAEKALQESEKRYRKLVENSPEPIVVYRNGMILYANPACIKLLGAKSLEELMGKSITRYFYSESVNLIEKRIQELGQTGISVPPTEEKVLRLDGTVIDVEVTGISIEHDEEPAFLMMYHDITTRKRVEKALRKSEEKYRLIAENMTDLVCVLDWDGFFKYASPSHVTVLGFPSETYEGNRARDWMHMEDFPEVRSQLEKTIQTKEGCVLEFRFRDIYGHWIWLEGKATPVFNEEGDFDHFLVVSREITERKNYEEKLSYMAYHDMLTGLPNRRLFNERLEQTLREAELNERKFAVVYMDMDYFKLINDTLGHDVGDKLLKQFANKVQNCIRDCDTLARLGGDEFTILITDIIEEQDAIRIVKQSLSSLQEPWDIEGRVLQLAASMGIAFYPSDGMTRHDLLRYADRALYHAKQDGKNNMKIYSNEGLREKE